MMKAEILTDWYFCQGVKISYIFNRRLPLAPAFWLKMISCNEYSLHLHFNTIDDAREIRYQDKEPQKRF